MHSEAIQKFNAIVKTLKDQVSLTSLEEWNSLLLENYQQFYILDYLEKYQADLIPATFKREDLIAFLDEINQALQDNGYFLDLLNQIPWDQAYEYSPFTLKDGSTLLTHDYFKYLLSFAYCLNKLNSLVRKDTEFLEVLIKHYWKVRKENNFYRLSNVLAVIKFHSIELPVILFLKARRKNKLSPGFAKWILSFNIFEATMVDFLVGFYDNARATIPLICYHPNCSKGSPSSFSSDGNAVNLVSPCPKEWADLYQVWNMAFVAQFTPAPFLLVKLLIPSVSNYRHRPTEYMHTRITALHLAMTYIDSATHAPLIKANLKLIGPSKMSLIKLWGRVNLAAAKKYAAQVAQIKK